ncbi:MAG: NirD/YgiW/YdeI family stress tolerance protein [Azoarcus sp.]|jgi:uncharacterized protein (TIGR00156 family)|nr:NirD/YgiW/YdeI family stress tolerance protein [Azoarcus sp.]
MQLRFARFALAALPFMLPAAAHAQGGFVESPAAQAKAQDIIVTAAEIRTLRDDTKVVLRGSILRKLGDEKYAFRDQSGEIVLEIDDDLWHGQTVTAQDTVEIRGEVDRDWGDSLEVEADSIKKL